MIPALLAGVVGSTAGKSMGAGLSCSPPAGPLPGRINLGAERNGQPSERALKTASRAATAATRARRVWFPAGPAAMGRELAPFVNCCFRATCVLFGARAAGSRLHRRHLRRQSRAATGRMLVTPPRRDAEQELTLRSRPGAPGVAYTIDSRCARREFTLMYHDRTGQTASGWSATAFFVAWLLPACSSCSGTGRRRQRAMGIAVVNDYGTPLGAAGARTRNLLRAADFLPFSMQSLRPCWVNREFKRLGDLRQARCSSTVRARAGAPRARGAAARRAGADAREQRAVLDLPSA